MSECIQIGSRPGSEAIARWISSLADLDTEVGDAERVDQLRLLEELKSAAAAAQARVTVAFDRSQRWLQRESGVPAHSVGHGTAAQVAPARRDSPVKGARRLGLARALVTEMPHTLAALQTGQISEWRATLVVRETACLSRQDRTTVDAELAARPGGLAELGDRAAAGETRRIAYRLDPHAVTDRARRAAADRRVTIRPAPDTMAMVTGLLPATQGVAVYAALTNHADTLRAAGDDRTRGQIMADTLVERCTGQATADDVRVEVNLVLTDHSLLGQDNTPAQLLGYGPLPAPFTRSWLRRTDSETEARIWLRRLYTNASTGTLVAMDSTRRCFTGKLRQFLIIRDQTCRTPWCDAPIRHIDHPYPAADGGTTSVDNAQGLCEACNYAEESPGWHTRPGPEELIETTAPTGHHYQTRPPPPPGPPPRHPTTRPEIFFGNLILAS